jgi:hypothetical protein
MANSSSSTFFCRNRADASVDAPSGGWSINVARLAELLQRPVLSKATRELTVLDTLPDRHHPAIETIHLMLIGSEARRASTQTYAVLPK